MICPECAGNNGLHAQGCELLREAWDELKTPTSLEQALKDKGYVVLFAIGVGVREDGQTSLKIAARPGVRALYGTQVWTTMRATIIGAIDRLMDSPLDDLELR